MMRNTSFGPVLFVLFVVAPRRYICSFNIPVTWLVVIKNTNNIIKNSLMAQTTCFALFGPVLLVVPPITSCCPGLSLLPWLVLMWQPVDLLDGHTHVDVAWGWQGFGDGRGGCSLVWYWWCDVVVMIVEVVIVVKTCGKAENDEAKSGNNEAKGVLGWRGVTEGDRTMWRRFDKEEKCWGVWGRQKTGVIRRWRTRPQLMCCALACGTGCPLISGARMIVRMTENKARMYRF